MLRIGIMHTLGAQEATFLNSMLFLLSAREIEVLQNQPIREEGHATVRGPVNGEGHATVGGGPVNGYV